MRTLVSQRALAFRAALQRLYRCGYTVQDYATILNDRRYGILTRAAALRLVSSKVYGALPFQQRRAAAKREFLRVEQ